MIEQLLKNPAFAELYKNAPQLNKIEVPKLNTGGFISSTPVIPTIVQTPIMLPKVVNNPTPKNGKGKWVLPVIILSVGIYAFYKITRWLEQDNENSKNN